MTNEPTIRIGAFAPLSQPGWVEAGRHLLAGLDLGARDVNASGGIGGRLLELMIRDTAGDPAKAIAAVDELAQLGVVALAGEYHSVVARAIAARSAALELPYLCSSAVIDALIEEPTDWIARLCPPQSRGWETFADFLIQAGNKHISVVTQPSIYWSSGTRILREQFASCGGSVLALDASALAPNAVCDELARANVTALLLLVGAPEPATAIVRAVRQDPRLHSIQLGAPAGQPEFASWAAALGKDGAAIPFLRYLPTTFGMLGATMETRLRNELSAPPSFVAFEGYDTIRLIAEVLRNGKGVSTTKADFWTGAEVEGARGRIRLSRPAGGKVWQWEGAPVQIADRDPLDIEHYRILEPAR